MTQRFYVDDYFHIGQMHLGSGKPCQDYSFSGATDEGAFALVSDGCSTGRHTDVGARVIALATVNTIQRWVKEKTVSIEKLDKMVTEQHKTAISKSIEAFGLELQDMLATCAYACITPEGGLINVNGDGVVAYIYIDGVVTLTSYQWSNNAPMYPAYAVDDYKSFIDFHGGHLDEPVLKIESYSYDQTQSHPAIFAPISNVITLGEAINGRAIKISESETKNLKFIAVFTDGVMQVEGMGWQDVVLGLLAFKNLEGEFAKRRMIRFIKDSKRDNCKGPLDDIAYAVIRIDHEISEEV